MCYFKIWYIDKTIEGTSLEDWNNAPDDGVIIIYEKFENGYSRVSAGSDWYWMMPNENVYQSGTSSEVAGEYLSHNAPENAVLKKGRWTTDEDFKKAYDEMFSLLNKV